MTALPPLRVIDPDARCVESVVSTLRDLLTRAEQGEILAIAVAYEADAGRVGTQFGGDTSITTRFGLVGIMNATLTEVWQNQAEAVTERNP